MTEHERAIRRDGRARLAAFAWALALLVVPLLGGRKTYRCLETGARGLDACCCSSALCCADPLDAAGGVDGPEGDACCPAGDHDGAESCDCCAVDYEKEQLDLVSAGEREDRGSSPALLAPASGGPSARAQSSRAEVRALRPSPLARAGPAAYVLNGALLI